MAFVSSFSPNNVFFLVQCSTIWRAKAASLRITRFRSMISMDFWAERRVSVFLFLKVGAVVTQELEEAGITGNIVLSLSPTPISPISEYSYSSYFLRKPKKSAIRHGELYHKTSRVILLEKGKQRDPGIRIAVDSVGAHGCLMVIDRLPLSMGFSIYMP